MTALGFESFRAFYQSDLQGIYGLLVVPACFLVYLLTLGRGRVTDGAQRFAFLYCLVFTVETLLDPICTGLLVRGATDGAATAVSLFFVLLGDFRVLLLAFLCCGVYAARAALLRATLWTFPVPVCAFLLNAALESALGPLASYTLYLIHELLFVALSLALVVRFGSAPFVRRCLLYVACYYALWAGADVLILLGVDAGYLLRAVPNQLYYAFFTPWVWLAARAHPPLPDLQASSSSDTQASR